MIRNTDQEFCYEGATGRAALLRGSDGYEAARRGTVWHRRVPDRYPEVIVQAVSADDIVSAIRYATVNGHKVSVVSGGHSFAASHLRDGAVLLDVSRIDHASIDADKGRAVVGPGKGGSVLMAELEAQGLFFPGGHCRESVSEVICCRADTAGTAGSTARRARA